MARPSGSDGSKPGGAPAAGAARREVTLYCDGACKGNPGVGGYGVILLCDGHQRELSGAEPMTTNNKMELTAAIEGLKVLSEPCVVTIFTDSEYLKKGITVWIHSWRTRGWRTAGKKPVQNRDLWEKLLEVSGKHEVKWHWVRGHSGDALNERCDELANLAIERLIAERAV
jgi:ribonuclease HI